MRLGPHDVRRARLRRTPLAAVTLAGFACTLGATLVPSLEPWLGPSRPSLLVLAGAATSGALVALVTARRAPGWSSTDDIAWGVSLSALSLVAGASPSGVGPGTLLFATGLWLLALRDPSAALVAVCAVTAAMIPVVHALLATSGPVPTAAGAALLALGGFAATLAQTRRLARALTERDTALFEPTPAPSSPPRSAATRTAGPVASRGRAQTATEDRTSASRAGNDTASTETTWDSLVDRVRSSVTLMAENAGVAASVQAELAGLAPPSTRIRAHLLRIAQEATTQALRHADPRSITVRLRRGDGGVVFELEDDGVANDASREKRSLASLRGRVAAVGGTAEIRRAAAGWVTRVRLPCEQLN